MQHSISGKDPRERSSQNIVALFQQFCGASQHDIVSPWHVRGESDDVTKALVFLRIRPLSKKASQRGGAPVLECHKQDTVMFSDTKTKNKDEQIKMFTFNHVFSESSSQEEVYTKTLSPFLQQFAAGVNTSLFCFGQTGSGKTHTMFGHPRFKDSAELGIVPRAFAALFKDLPALKQNPNASIKYRISVVEIYNEQLHDLLEPRGEDEEEFKRVDLREHPKKGIFLHGLKTVSIQDAGDCDEILRALVRERATGSTAMNKRSSRSHVIVSVQLSVMDYASGQGVTSTLRLIDLAGSERQKKAESSGHQVREGAAINLSLSCLGNVIDALINKRTHVPFRASKLTRMLQDALTGNSQTIMITTVAQTPESAEETLSALRFADRMKAVENRARPNEVTLNKDAQLEAINRQLRTEKEQLNSKVASLEQHIAELQALYSAAKTTAQPPPPQDAHETQAGNRGHVQAQKHTPPPVQDAREEHTPPRVVAAASSVARAVTPPTADDTRASRVQDIESSSPSSARGGVDKHQDKNNPSKQCAIQ